MNNKKRNYCICGHDMDDEGCIIHEVKNGMIVPKEKYAYKGSLTPTNTSMTQHPEKEPCEWESELFGLLYDEYGDVGQNQTILSFIRQLLNKCTHDETCWHEKLKTLLESINTDTRHGYREIVRFIEQMGVQDDRRRLIEMAQQEMLEECIEIVRQGGEVHNKLEALKK